jgi:predicted CopG family antitoxin
MKTLTLTNEAYERLKDWKTETNDSFSTVVLRMVPKRGTLAEMVEGFRQLPPLTEQQSEVMAEAVAWANDWSNATEAEQPWHAISTPSVDAS